MALLVWVGFGAFFCVSLVVGFRLLALSRRTGELPELLIGIGVLGIGPIGFSGIEGFFLLFMAHMIHSAASLIFRG